MYMGIRLTAILTVAAYSQSSSVFRQVLSFFAVACFHTNPMTLSG